ncbi:hypothetical protein HHK36_003004 [Tetracentron sinense]|uniref:Uncharacterized protein n=1 Tax=Tetracentron sinense TaxID=13715 RepID=A0A834ZRK6_TETSI|nr:hypothetical protein HHK36_003004 [Tetracentron sinense]
MPQILLHQLHLHQSPLLPPTLTHPHHFCSSCSVTEVRLTSSITAVKAYNLLRALANSRTCIANPQRVKMVAKQIMRELSNMLLTDKVLQYAVLPKASLGADNYLSSLTTISDVEVSTDLQVTCDITDSVNETLGSKVGVQAVKAATVEKMMRSSRLCKEYANVTVGAAVRRDQGGLHKGRFTWAGLFRGTNGVTLEVVKVYLSLFGDEIGNEVALAGLKAKAKYVRGELGKCMKLRLTPKICFIEDESIERGSRVRLPSPLSFYMVIYYMFQKQLTLCEAILDRINNEKKNADGEDEGQSKSFELPQDDRD